MRRLFAIGCWLLMVTAAMAQGIPYLYNFKATEYHGHNQNFDIITGKDGTVYVANFEGLLYYDHTTWRMIHTPGVTRVTALFRDSKGTIWAGGYNYFGRVTMGQQNLRALQNFDTHQAFHGEVRWIWEKNGHVFFLVSDDHIYTLDGETISKTTGEQLPTGNKATFVASAHINQRERLDDGLTALATDGEGIIFLDQNDQELFRIKEENGLCSNAVAHITYDEHGTLWGATDNGVFCIAFPSIYTHFTALEGLRGEVTAIYRLGRELYVGTLSGLYRLSGKRFVEVPSVRHACWQLAPYHQSLLAATADGVFQISASGQLQQLTTKGTLSLLVDQKGIFCGQMDGIYYHQGNRHEKISDIEKAVKIISDRSGRIFVQNLYGRLWISNDHKTFHRFQADSHEEMSTLVALDGNVIPVNMSTVRPFHYPAFTQTDNSGIVWLTDNKAKHLYAYMQKQREERLSKLVYPLMDYSVRALMHEGQMIWVGGDKGLNVVDERHADLLRKTEPRLLLRAVTLSGDSVLWGGYGEQPGALADLKSDDNHLTFYYSTDYHSLLLKTQYRTRLNKADWQPWETDTKEELSNLIPGHYTFEVQARDAFGRESNVVSVQFTVERPFLERWYMILLYLVLFALLVYGLLRYRLHRLEKEKHRLEGIVKERTTEVVRLEKMATVGKLTQGLIDRILNPLNYINNFAKLSEGLVDDVSANIEDEKEHMDQENYEDTVDVLHMLKGNLQKVGEHGQNTTRTLKVMEEMLKDRSGGIVEMNLTAVLEQNREMVMEYYKQPISEHHIDIVFEGLDQPIMMNGNAQQLSKTFMNMLGNAIYAVGKKAQRTSYTPQVTLTVTRQQKTVDITIHDNGIGIETAILHKIFDPFFTTKTTGEAAGVGLYISKEIVQNHGGDITVRSEKDQFTEFIITLPTL